MTSLSSARKQSGSTKRSLLWAGSHRAKPWTTPRDARTCWPFSERWSENRFPPAPEPSTLPVYATFWSMALRGSPRSC